MRPTLFRTEPIEVNDVTTICQKDLGGRSPVTLYLENEDTYGSLNMKWGSKNGNILFTAVEQGSLTKDIEIEITKDGAAASVTTDDSDPYTVFIVINLGQGMLTADEVIAAVNADSDADDYVVASRAKGSDGSAETNLMESTPLEGDFDSTTLGTVHVYHGPTVDGPWDESTAASAAFNTMAADDTKAFTIDSPVRGLMITADDGGSPTHVRVTAVAVVNG